MTRRAAALLWGALLVVPFAFAAVASRVAREAARPDLAEPLLWAAAAAAALNLALAWSLPARLGPARAQSAEAVAFTRVLVSLALCEAAAMAPLVAHMLTGDARVLALAAVALAAHLALYPSARRWAALLPAPGGAAGPAEVR